MYDDIRHLIDSALKAGMDKNIGHEYTKDVEDRYREEYRKPIVTPWNVVNELLQGGLGEGDFGLIFGGPGGGKSWSLIALGAAAVKAGYNVCHYTLELSEAYVPSNIKEFAKRKGVSSLVNKVAGWAEKVGKGIRGGTAIGYNYSTLILDMTYQGSEIRINTDNDTVTLYDEPVYSFNDFKQVYLDNQDESDNSLEERIAEALDKINEELCPAGKAYIKRRKAAGEKSSAYLSGRAVKVCKGQMSGKAKKKK